MKDFLLVVKSATKKCDDRIWQHI